MRQAEPEILAEPMEILRGAAGRRLDQPSEPEVPIAPEVVESELPEFPEMAWRGTFADYREAMSQTTEASDVFHFAALWAAVAVSIGRRTFMFAGERVYPNIYVALFGPTGDKKTTAQRQILNCRLLPESVQVVRGLGSTEGLADSLRRDHGGDAVSLSFWEDLTTVFARGRWSGSTLLEYFTECFDCPPEWGMKYRKDPVQVTSPTPTILAGTTAEWFWKNARPDDFYGGFGNRFAFFTGEKKRANPNPLEPGEDALQRVREALHRINQMTPMQAQLTPDACQLWERFYVDWENKDRAGLYGAAVKRIHVYIRKLAMAYAALEETLPEITIDQLKASIAVGLYAAECARLLIDAQNAAIRPEGQIEQKILDWIKRNNGAKKRYMQQTLSKVTGSCEVFNRAVQALIRADLIQIQEGRVFISRG